MPAADQPLELSRRVQEEGSRSSDGVKTLRYLPGDHPSGVGFSLSPGSLKVHVVTPGSLAEKAGIVVGDKLVSFAGVTTTDPAELPALYEKHNKTPREEVSLEFRGSRRTSVLANTPVHGELKSLGVGSGVDSWTQGLNAVHAARR